MQTRLCPTTPAIPARFTTANSTRDRFTGQLYQFTTAQALAKGAYIVIDGPHDTFGQVVSVERKKGSEGEYFLHLVRGVRRPLLDKPQLYWLN
ncbi:hypothetical protein D3C71_18970 [compost metagenome]